MMKEEYFTLKKRGGDAIKLVLTGVCFGMLGLMLSALPGYAQSKRIIVDGSFSDWGNLSAVYADPAGDQQAGDIDFGRLWIANDEQFLFLRIEVGTEINLQDFNAITLYLDTDNNSDTGTPIHGLGAELEWSFGVKAGIFTTTTASVAISHRHIGLVTAPTVTSKQFEIAIEKSARPAGQSPLFPEDTIGVVIADKGVGGDVLPNSGTRLHYVFDSSPLPPLPSLTLRKQDAAHLRILSYNVLRDGLFDPQRMKSFERILTAIEPDIIGFQEIYDHTAEQAVAQVKLMFSSSGLQQWYGSKVAPDIIVVSRYPIVATFPIEGNGAFLLNLRPKYDSQLLFIVAHPPCCENNAGRQYEIDAIIAFIRDAETQGGRVDVLPNTPILIVGDLNLVGYARQLHTLLSGDIVNSAQFGPAFSPDWDGGNFTDLTPRHADLPMTYTWHDDNSNFSPGRLDFMIYSDSVLRIGNHFILFTPAMRADSLASHGLQPQDGPTASDHLPVVSDLILSASTAVEPGDRHQPYEFGLVQNYPNPFNLTTAIHYQLPVRTKVKLLIYNRAGQLVRTLWGGEMLGGSHVITWDATDNSGQRVASGIYLCIINAGEHTSVRKLVLMK